MRLALVCALLGGAISAAAQTPIEVQPVKELVRTGTLATCTYSPTPQESPFFKRLSADEVATGSFMAPYAIQGKTDKFVSWFGIVRGIAKAKDKKHVTLLLEHKYFDGLTDCHIMLVSHSGGGDFRATAEVDPGAIPPLALVRIYGKVVAEEGSVPQIAAEYVRVWPWLTFTLTDLGAADKSNPRWAKYAQAHGGRIYNPYPQKNYYLRLLGDPAEFGLNLKPEQAP